MSTHSTNFLCAVFMVTATSESHIAIRVPRTEELCAVRNAFAAEQGVSRGRIILYKPKEFLSWGLGGRKELKDRLAKHGGDLTKFCDDLCYKEDSPVSDLFNLDKPAAESSALVASIGAEEMEQPGGSGEENDTLSPLARRFLTGVNCPVQQLPPLSAFLQNYFDNQNDLAPFLDGRYATTPTVLAPPIQIYHPVFAGFSAEARDERMELPTEVVTKTKEFMVAMSQIALYEGARSNATRKRLGDILGFAIDGTRVVDDLPYDCSTLPSREPPQGSVLLATVQVQDEIELGSSSDGIVHGSFSYREHWAQQTDIIEVSFCPSFIISLVGPWLNISGAIWTTDVIVHRLTNYVWLGNDCIIDDTHVLAVTRVLNALRQALSRLREHYRLVRLSSPRRLRYFPLATSYLDPATGKQVSFTYDRYLSTEDPSCVSFLATLADDDRKKIVVKFVERYGEVPHRLLASRGFAPKLLYFGNVWPDEPECDGCGPRKMVIMEFLEGVSASDIWAPGNIPEKVHDTVREAVGILHGDGKVHGDIRPPNASSSA